MPKTSNDLRTMYHKTQGLSLVANRQGFHPAPNQAVNPQLSQTGIYFTLH
jgi:hypothetical protein